MPVVRNFRLSSALQPPDELRDPMQPAGSRLMLAGLPPLARSRDRRPTVVPTSSATGLREDVSSGSCLSLPKMTAGNIAAQSDEGSLNAHSVGSPPRKPLAGVHACHLRLSSHTGSRQLHQLNDPPLPLHRPPLATHSFSFTRQVAPTREGNFKRLPSTLHDHTKERKTRSRTMCALCSLSAMAATVSLPLRRASEPFAHDLQISSWEATIVMRFAT